jgi:hypothetical protein
MRSNRIYLTVKQLQEEADSIADDVIANVIEKRRIQESSRGYSLQ